MKNYTEINAKTIDRWVEEGWTWGTPITASACDAVRRGQWDVLLTPTRPVPKDWFLPFENSKILGLASGGGQQMPVFSLLGAECTIMDLSDRQLSSEKMVADREGYTIEIVKADMTQPFPFKDGAFDLIFHPVSNCYIEDVHHVWRECHRVLRPGGILLAGLDNGINYLFEDDEEGKPLVVTNTLPFNPLKKPELMENLLKDDSGVQFSHTFDEQIGGQLKAGFVITGAYEDFNHDPEESFATTAAGIPAFWATRAMKAYFNQCRGC
jgi:SAM-dependent methyltransferase